jgi:hypothetical protein
LRVVPQAASCWIDEGHFLRLSEHRPKLLMRRVCPRSTSTTVEELPGNRLIEWDEALAQFSTCQR